VTAAQQSLVSYHYCTVLSTLSYLPKTPFEKHNHPILLSSFPFQCLLVFSPPVSAAIFYNARKTYHKLFAASSKFFVSCLLNSSRKSCYLRTYKNRGTYSLNWWKFQLKSIKTPNHIKDYSRRRHRKQISNMTKTAITNHHIDSSNEVLSFSISIEISTN